MMLNESLVDRVWRYKYELRRRTDALYFSVGCSVIAAIIYIGFFKYFLRAFIIVHPVMQYVVWGAVCVTGGGTLLGLLVHMRYRWFGCRLVVTPQEKTLFNISDDARVQVLTEQQQLQQQQLQQQQLKMAEVNRQQRQQQQNVSNIMYSSSPQQQLSHTPSPASYYPPPRYHSLPYSPTDSPYSQGWASTCSPHTGSWLNSSSTSHHDYNTTPQSLSLLSGGSGLFGGGSSPLSGGVGVGGGYNICGGFSGSASPISSDLRQRHASISPHRSPKKGESFLSSRGELSDFLERDRSQREADERFQAAVDATRFDRSGAAVYPQQQQQLSPYPQQQQLSRWSRGLGRIRDWLPELSRFRYQPASLTAQHTTSGSTDSNKLASTAAAAGNSISSGSTSAAASADLANTSAVSHDVWSRMGVSQDQVDRWRQNLRKWLSETILSRVVSEIENINKTLVNMGSDDIQIGKVSVSTLRAVSQSKSQLLPSLDKLLPFLDISVHQEYLVQRLTELASTGCMSSYRWNSGGEFKSKPWQENLPTDSDIIIHMFCCYFDARLPVHPRCIDGRTFTSQHFSRTPEKPCVGEKTDAVLCIYQTGLRPPHFKVIIAEQTYHIESGRNNLFHALLVFLYHIKTKEKGMLRRVNLGLSGVNILWIFDY